MSRRNRQDDTDSGYFLAVLQEVVMICGITHRFAAFRLLVLSALFLCGSGSLLAQTYNTIYIFGGGGSPRGTLIEGRDGNLYGTTYGYGGRINGMIFKITPSGAFTTLHSGGGTFQAGLTLGTDGNFYGTSVAGGTYAHGYVFKITPSGTVTVLYMFDAVAEATYRVGLSRPATETFMARPSRVERTVTARCSESPQAAR